MTLQMRDPQPVTAASSLLDRLGESLEVAGVVYCQWKGHWKRARWESGAGDVDLLVDPAWAERLHTVLARLGFKLAVPPPEEGVGLAIADRLKKAAGPRGKR